MKNYWSCSPFSDLIRKFMKIESKPSSGTSEEWTDWTARAKVNKIRYFIVEVLLDKIQSTLTFPYSILNIVRIYFKNRYVSKYHYLQTYLFFKYC